MKTPKTTSREPLSRARFTPLAKIAAAWCVGAIILISSTARAQNLYVADTFSGNIYEYTNGVASEQGTFATGIADPMRLTFDKAGDLFMNTGGGNIYEYTNGIASQLGIFATSPGGSVTGMAFDKAGNLFVVEFYSGNIYEYTNGIASQMGIFATGLSYPYDLAFDSAGNLFVADNHLGVDGYITIITPGGSKSTFDTTGSSQITTLAFDSAGDLFVSADASGQIYEYTNGVASEKGIYAYGLNNPAGLVFDSAGNLYVACPPDNTIYEFTNGVASAQGIFASGLNNPIGLAFAPNTTLSVKIKMFAGIILNNGNIGSNYLIQATANLSTSNWTTLTNVTLPSQPYIYIDYSSYTNSQQFYQVVPQ